MSSRLRSAVPEDAAGIARLLQAAWPDDTADAAEIARLIKAGDRCTILAEIDESLAGFCDAFATVGPSGETRWEIDLLAVHPEYRGYGLARSLIRAATDAGRERVSGVARGLVRADNEPARHAFAAAGYAPLANRHRLYVLPMPETSVSQHLQTDNVIAVSTFAYRGVWLEGDISANAIAAALFACSQRQGDIAGAVIPADDADAIAVVEQHGFSLVDHYHWWIQPLTTGAAQARR